MNKKNVFRLLSFILTSTLFLFLGCKNNSGPELNEGEIKIIIITEGENTNGYILQINETHEYETGANDTLTVANQAYGTYEITLRELPENCSVSSENPVTAHIDKPDEITVSFEVTCNETSDPGPDTGTLEIITHTSLIHSDQTYSLILNGTKQLEISANDTLSTNLAPGNYTLELTGVNPPCYITPTPTNEIIIEPNETSSDDFYIFCQTISDYRILYKSNFEDGNYYYIIQPDGTIHTLAENFDYYGRPVLSPDQKKIAFTAYTLDIDREYELYTINTDGTNFTKLTDFNDDLAFLGDISWSPDGSKIVFSKADQPSTNDLYVINQDGTGLAQLTDNHEVADRTPKWAPDGSSIAFKREQNNSQDLYEVTPDGVDLLNITNSPDRNEGNISWSPDSQQLRYSASENGERNIFITDIDGSDIINITQNQDYHGESEAWSPDGSKIGFVQFNSDRSESNIYVMNSDGSNFTKLTSSVPEQLNINPTWSPDGTKIVFTRNVFLHPDYSAEKFYHVFVMNTDGTELNDITFRGPEGFDPIWIPLH